MSYPTIYLLTHDTIENGVTFEKHEDAQKAFDLETKFEEWGTSPRPTFLYCRIQSFNRDLTPYCAVCSSVVWKTYGGPEHTLCACGRDKAVL